MNRAFESRTPRGQQRPPGPGAAQPAERGAPGLERVCGSGGREGTLWSRLRPRRVALGKESHPRAGNSRQRRVLEAPGERKPLSVPAGGGGGWEGTGARPLLRRCRKVSSEQAEPARLLPPPLSPSQIKVPLSLGMGHLPHCLRAQVPSSEAAPEVWSLLLSPLPSPPLLTQHRLSCFYGNRPSKALPGGQGHYCSWWRWGWRN